MESVRLKHQAVSRVANDLLVYGIFLCLLRIHPPEALLQCGLIQPGKVLIFLEGEIAEKTLLCSGVSIFCGSHACVSS